jgi:penicillin-binding protein 2
MSYPSYDPNLIYDKWEDYQKDPMNPLFNRALNAFYPPGSVIKVGLAIGLLQEGVSPQEGVFCRGKFSLGNRDFYCWLRSGHGWENMRTAIRDSCDVYFYSFCYNTLGPRKMEAILRSFSFGESVPFELPNAWGIIPNPEWKRKVKKEPWYGGDTINMSIGQGYLKATLLQQCLMVIGIANDGVIYKPFLVKEIRDPEGRVVWKNKKSVYKVIKAPLEHFALVKEAMRDVVRSGTGIMANSPIAEIAGKDRHRPGSFYKRKEEEPSLQTQGPRLVRLLCPIQKSPLCGRRFGGAWRIWRVCSCTHSKKGDRENIHRRHTQRADVRLYFCSLWRRPF